MPDNDESGCSKETQIADCRLRNVTAASSHCVLTANRTAFHFLSRNFHHFLSPLPTRHQHLTLDTFITSGSFFSRGNKLPAPAAASTGKSSGNRRRETQTVKIVSDERSAPVLLSPLKLQRLLFSRSVFFFLFRFPDAFADIYTDVFQVGAICKIKNKKSGQGKKNSLQRRGQSQKCFLGTRQLKKKIPETPHVFPQR